MNKLCILKRKRRNQNQQKKDLAETMKDRDQIEKMVVHPMKKEVKNLSKQPQTEDLKMEIRKVNKEEEMITEDNSSKENSENHQKREEYIRL